MKWISFDMKNIVIVSYMSILPDIELASLVKSLPQGSNRSSYPSGQLCSNLVKTRSQDWRYQGWMVRNSVKRPTLLVWPLWWAELLAVRMIVPIG